MKSLRIFTAVVIATIISLSLFSATGALVQTPLGEAQATDIDIPVTKLYQNDYPQKMDNSEDTIAKNGCSITAFTMLINQAVEVQGLHEKNPDGTEGPIISYTPAELNTLLNNHRYQQKTYKKDVQGDYVRPLVVEKEETKNGWSVTIGEDGKPIGSDTDLNIGALLKVVKSDTKSRSFENEGLTMKEYRKDDPNGVTLDENYKKVLDELNAGRPVVVRTRDNKHTVLVKSFQQAQGQPEGRGRYNIADPWKKPDGTSIEWLDDEEYKNKIWSSRTGVFQKGGLHDPYEVPSDYWIDPEYLDDLEMNPDQYGLQTLEPSFPFLPEDVVGGIAEFPEIAQTELEAAEPLATNYGLWAGIAAGATLGAIALFSTAWYARRRWLS